MCLWNIVFIYKWESNLSQHVHICTYCKCADLAAVCNWNKEGWSDMVWIFCEMVEEDWHGKMGKGETEANWSCEMSSARLSEITTPPINEVCYEQQLNYIGRIGRCELLKQNQTSITSGVEDVWESAVCRRPTDQSDFALLLNTMSTQKYPSLDLVLKIPVNSVQKQNNHRYFICFICHGITREQVSPDHETACQFITFEPLNIKMAVILKRISQYFFKQLELKLKVCTSVVTDCFETHYNGAQRQN